MSAKVFDFRIHFVENFEYQLLALLKPFQLISAIINQSFADAGNFNSTKNFVHVQATLTQLAQRFSF